MRLVSSACKRGFLKNKQSRHSYLRMDPKVSFPWYVRMVCMNDCWSHNLVRKAGQKNARNDIYIYKKTASSKALAGKNRILRLESRLGIADHTVRRSAHSKNGEESIRLNFLEIINLASFCVISFASGRHSHLRMNAKVSLPWNSQNHRNGHSFDTR